MYTSSLRPVHSLPALILCVSLVTVNAPGAVAGPDEVAAILERLKEAPEAEVERASAEIDALLPEVEAPKAGTLLDALGVAWYRHKRYEEALDRFDALVALQPDTASLVFLKIAEIHRQREDLERELEALHSSIRAPGKDTHRDVMDADNTSNIAYRRLGQIYESQGKWAKALASWERWSPTSWCGNEMATYRHQRQMAIARCMAHLHGSKAALESLWDLLAEEHCLNGVHPEAAWSYAEIASEVGRIEEARRDFRRLPPDRRERFLVSIAIWGGYRAGDATTMIDALSHFDIGEARLPGYRVPLEFQRTVTLLADLGPRAQRILTGRIELAEIRAIAVAGLSGDRAYLPVLRALQPREGLDETTAKNVSSAIRLLDEAGEADQEAPHVKKGN